MRRVVEVHAEGPVTLASAIATAMARAQVITVEIPAIRGISCNTTRGFRGVKRSLQAALSRDDETAGVATGWLTHQNPVDIVTELVGILGDI